MNSAALFATTLAARAAYVDVAAEFRRAVKGRRVIIERAVSALDQIARYWRPGPVPERSSFPVLTPPPWHIVGVGTYHTKLPPTVTLRPAKSISQE
jgi:hypothetical protein